jgi:hypothetical protein
VHKLDWRVIALVGVDLAIAAAGPVWDRHSNTDMPLEMGAAVVAVWTYFMVWLIQRRSVEAIENPASNPIRDAIAAAFVVTYLVIVGWTAFFHLFKEGEQYQLAPLTQMFVTNFTFLTGVVVGSYFGADVVKQVAQIRGQQHKPAPNQTQITGATVSPADQQGSSASSPGTTPPDVNM